MDSNAQYYILEGEKISNKLNEAATLINEDLILKIKSISDELEKINDKTGEPHIEKCHDMTEKLQEIFDQITKQYTHNVIEKNAADWQQKYNALKALEGENGYNFALEKGFEPRHDSHPIQEVHYNATRTLSDAFDGRPQVEGWKRLITYEWNAYTKVDINKNTGYIDINLERYKMNVVRYADGTEKYFRPGKEKMGSTRNITITNDSDFSKYYNGRGNIGSVGGNSSGSTGGNSSSGAPSGGSVSHGF